MTTPAAADVYRPAGIPERIASARREIGLPAVVARCARWGAGLLAGAPFAVRGERGAFAFEGEEYRYLNHPHRWTWLTERTVEVPVVQRLVDAHAGRRVLEVGNVLSHYRPQQHTIADKYEQAPGVLNLDVVDLASLGTFDLVVAISTLEHVGWDEVPRSPEKAVEATLKLRESLAPGGRLVVTVPMGYNPVFVAALRDGAVPFDHTAALRRVGPMRWRQVPVEEIWDVPYDFLLAAANAVLVATLEAPATPRG